MSLILFEDEHLLVINKPHGWNTHAPAPFAGEGVYDWLKHRERRWATLAIIHRLDKETSGVMVFGKTSAANRSLTRQFETRAVQKKYLLLTDRPVKSARFTSSSTIVRSGAKYISRPLQPGDERAETHFRRVSIKDGYTLVEAEPITGRTHQIRVHTAEQGFPILGDIQYGGTRAARVFLHAAELSLEHPVTGERVTFKTPPEWQHVPGSGSLRAAIIESPLTTAFRLVHGASDGEPGLYVDKLGGFLLAQSEQELTPNQRERVAAMARAQHSSSVYHKALRTHVRGTAEASPAWIFGEAAPERFTVRENGLVFELSFNEGYSIGLFLDQRDNRRRLLINHVAAEFPLFPAGANGVEVLNTFAYTCGFSVAAAKAGARTTSVDLSRKYLEWGKRNFVLNGLDPTKHDFIYGDAFEWLRRLTKKGRTFDCVILDPPTFSQSKKSGTWQAEKDYGQLVAAALPLLKSGGVLFASTNAARLEPEKLLAMIGKSLTKAQRKILQQHYVPQPPDFSISREEPAYLKTVWLRIS